MKKILILACALLASVQMMAVIAYPELVRFSQPNTEIQVNIFLKGDEKVHWAETEDGYSLLFGDNHQLMYAMLNDQGDMVASSFMATDIKDRPVQVQTFLATTPKHLHFSDSQVKQLVSLWTDLSKMRREPKTMSTVTGEKRFLVILFAFNDKAFTHSKNDFRNLFNQVGYTSGGAIGSVRDYYYDVSYGQFTLNIDVVGPYRASQNASYYGNNDDQTSGYQAFAEEAVEMASHDVNFANYDNDNDGYIDGLHIIFAGHGEEAGGGEDLIWSHKWNIFSAPEYNNTIVNLYSCSPECSGSMGDAMTNIGVICHELGHVFGAPDYYDTDYSGSGGQYPGLGTWDIMSSGSWNRGGKSPAHHNPYTKIYIYKWASCDTLSTQQTVLMDNVTRSKNDYHRINTSTSGDFFLLENRMKLKWDKPLGSEGLLVYHVHPDVHGSSVSNYTHPMQLYLLANTSSQYPTSSVSSYGDITGENAVWPHGNGRADSLTDYSTPALRPWSHQVNNTPLTHISKNLDDSTVAFCFKGAEPAPFCFTGEGVSNSQVRLDWKRYGSYKYVVTMSRSNQGQIPDGFYNVGDTVNGDRVVVYKGSDRKVLVDSLITDTNYFFQTFLCLTDSTYTTGLSTWAKPLSCPASRWSSENFDEQTAGSLPECWDVIYGQWGVTDFDVPGVTLESPALMCRNDGLTGGMIAATPFGVDSTGNMVMSFKALHPLVDSVEVMFKSEPMGEWMSMGFFTAGTSFTTHHVALPNVTSFSRVGFRYSGSDVVYIDDITLQEGYLLMAESKGHGHITPQGASIVQIGDTVNFTIQREPGYKVQRVTVDGASQTFTLGDRNSYFTLGVEGNHHVVVEFARDLDIEEAVNNMVSVFPNPTQGSCQIVLSETAEVSLYDITGRKLWSQKMEAGQHSLPTEQLPNGVYVLRAGLSTTKIIKR